MVLNYKIQKHSLAQVNGKLDVATVLKEITSNVIGI